jgi:hypothetical protein
LGPGLGVVGRVLGEQLDGDVGVALRVMRAIHDGEGSGPEHADDVVSPDAAGRRRSAGVVCGLDALTLSG